MHPQTQSAKEIDVFVGARVRMARVMAGLSQESLGEKLGITFQQVQKYEKGKNRIGASRMVQIAQALGRPVSWFFDEVVQKDGGGGKPDVLTRIASTREGLALAEAFLGIRDAALRHQLVVLAQAAAAATKPRAGVQDAA